MLSLNVIEVRSSDNAMNGMRLISFATALAAALIPALSCAHAAAPSPAGSTVEVLDYIVGNPALWPRIGNHYSNQIIDEDRREVCWVKYADPRRFECWRWDDAFVYHATDNAIDGSTGESYHFSDGRWLPRHMTGVWTLDVAANTITWFTPACSIEADKSHGFPYRQRAWLEPQRDAGGDLGRRDTLVLEYAPYDPVSGRTNPERFYFARGAGWYEWQRDQTDLVFNVRGGPVVPMNRSVWCASPP